jgi:hypothetical protein
MVLEDWRPDEVVGIARGGVPAAIMMSHYFNIPMKTITIQLRDGKATEADIHQLESESSNAGTPAKLLDLAGPKLLVIDDINDTGETFKWLTEQGFPSSHFVHYAALVDNVGSDFKVDYYGTEVDKAHGGKASWIVFPWENWWEYEKSI